MNMTAYRTAALRQSRKRALRYWQLYAFLFLPLAYLIVFHYVPMVGSQIAFRNYSPIKGIWKSDWAGLKYFTKFVRSYQFERVLTNTLRISIYAIVAGF
ncbi:MAG TPA: sugar ABC transporter permease, partial [Clostridia bacterium]|nr:sugar ABC transporter permease [Clostridia bacterium]